MTPADLARELRHALSPADFARDRLGFIPDAWQARVLNSPSKRILLNCSRQSGKSSVSAILAAHTALYHPGSLTLLFSKAQRQSAELFAKVSGCFKALDVPPKLESDNALSCRLANGSRVVSLPGDGDSIRGFSAPALVIEDEAAFVTDALYAAIRPMLAVSGGRLLLLSTPHGKRGHFYNAWHSDAEPWQRERITADQCPRITPEFLQAERDTLGEWWFRQEYGCEFCENTDQLFSTEAIQGAISAAVAPMTFRITT